MVDAVYVRRFMFQRYFAQIGHDELDFLPAVGEDDGLLVQGLAEEVLVMLPVAHIAAGVLVHDVHAAVPLHQVPLVRHVHETLDVQTDALFPLVRHRSRASPAGARVQPVLGQGHVPQSGGEAYPAGIYAGEGPQPLQHAEKLQPPFVPHERVHLIDDDEAQVAEHIQAGPPLVGDQALQGFRGDLQDALRMLDQPVLFVHGGIPVPFGDGYIGV